MHYLPIGIDIGTNAWVAVRAVALSLLVACFMTAVNVSVGDIPDTGVAYCCNKTTCIFHKF